MFTTAGDRSGRKRNPLSGGGWRIDVAGRLSNSLALNTWTDATLNPYLQVIGSGADSSAAGVVQFNAGANARATLNIAKSFGASIGTYTRAAAAGNSVGELCFQSAISTKFEPIAMIRANIDGGTLSAGTISDTSMPGYLSFWTAPNTTIVPTEKWRVTELGEFISGGVGRQPTATGTGAASTDLRLIQINSSVSMPAIALNCWWSGVQVACARLMLNKAADNTIGTMTTVSNGESLGVIGMAGSDGSNFILGSQITTTVEGTVAANTMPSRLSLWTSTVGPVERIRIDSTGRVIVAGCSGGALSIGGASNSIQNFGVTDPDSDMSFGSFNATTSSAASIHFYRSVSGVLGTATHVDSGHNLGGIQWWGAQQDTVFATQSRAAWIRAEVDGTVTSGGTADMPGRLLFLTTPDGSGTPAERIRIDKAGLVTITGTEICPTISGGSAAGSTLILQSTTGAGSSDFIDFKTATQLTRWRIASAGNLTNDGNAANVYAGIAASSTPPFQIQGTNGNNASLAMGRWSADASGPRIHLYKSRNATIGTGTAPNSGDDLGDISFGCYDTTANVTAAAIRVQCDGAVGGANDVPARMMFYVAQDGAVASERLRIDSAGVCGLLNNTQLKLAVGTATLSPLLFQAGTNLTTTVDGAMEFDGQSLFFSPDASDRRLLPSHAYIRLHADFTLTSTTSYQKLFNTPTNGQLQVPTGWYMFECMATLTTMSATSGNAAFQVAAGTATIVNSQIWWTAIDATAAAVGAFQSGMARSNQTGAAATNMATATTATEMQFLVRGTFEISVAGTIIPQISLLTATAAVAKIGTYFMCWRGGATTDTSLGNWS